MLDTAPLDLVVLVPLNSSTASLDFVEFSSTVLSVLSPAGKSLPLVAVPYETRIAYTFETEVDGIYTVTTNKATFCLPILGRLYACRNGMLLHTPTCSCCADLDKTLRTLDCLLRCTHALASAGDKEAATSLYELATTLCDHNCGC